MCLPTIDDCQLARRTVLDSFTAELGPNASIPATECGARENVYCAAAVVSDGGAYNACAPDPESCTVWKTTIERPGQTSVGECMAFPSSRIDLPAVRPIDFRMWCFRDQRTRAGSGCQRTQHGCRVMVERLANVGMLQPRAWGDGEMCAPYAKVICYPQLDRRQEQVKYICTPSFEECEARSSEVTGPDFQVVGSCGIVTGNKPW